MNSKLPELDFLEPERYELREAPRYQFELSRRDFLHVLGAGLLISVAGGTVTAQRFGGGRSTSLAERLHIGQDGVITVLTSKVEIGQGSRTQLTQAAAEELRVPVGRIHLIMADSEVVPDDGGTAGSRTTPSTVPSVRRACAAARQLLLNTAASAFEVDVKGLTLRDGQVEGLGAGRQFGYADLAAEKYASALQTESPAAEANLTAVNEWRVLGTSVLKVGGEEIVRGTHRYPSDIVRPGMLYGRVLRAPSYGAQLTAIDLPSSDPDGGLVTVRDGDFVGFAARTSFEAEKARDAAAKSARWQTSDHPSSDQLYEHLRSRASSQRSRRDERGSFDRGIEAAEKKLNATYHVAFVQHAPMEPRAAVAEWNDGQITVWTGTQQPARVHQELSRSFRLAAEQVRVIVPDTGGGFGGKHTGEVAVEAARLALAAGRPVSLCWSREEEFTWAYFRPAGVIDTAGGLDSKGQLTAWEQVNFNSGSSALATAYDVPNARTEFKYTESPLREGSYRALASTANTFARESFMDELAAAAELDPFEFRLRNLSHQRLRPVLVAAAERFNWKSVWQRPSARRRTGVGLACGTEKGSYAACCVSVEVEPDGTYRVREVIEAFECGAIQNPGNLRAQVEGCIIQGLGAALHEEIRFKDGKILNPRFSEYAVPRFSDLPKIETVLVNRPDLPSAGAGETPIIGIAPAIANALFNATGVRLRTMPIRNGELRAAT